MTETQDILNVGIQFGRACGGPDGKFLRLIELQERVAVINREFQALRVAERLRQGKDPNNMWVAVQPDSPYYGRDRELIEMANLLADDVILFCLTAFGCERSDELTKFLCCFRLNGKRADTKTVEGLRLIPEAGILPAVLWTMITVDHVPLDTTKLKHMEAQCVRFRYLTKQP